MFKNKRILVLGDAHVDDQQDLRRFNALGNYIEKNKPDEIISIGDFMSMNCLSEWDRNKRKLMENKRYKSEVEAGKKALWHIQSASDAKLVYIMGNHENRVDRYLETDPTFHGFVDLKKDLNLYKWKVINYKDVYTVNGISFTHIPIAGNGKPIANPNVAAKALRLFSTSVVFGHTHTLDHSAEHRHGAAHLNQALCCGCFFEHVDLYAQGSKTDYWRGIIMLNVYSTNRFDIETVAMSRLLKEYK